MGSLSPPAGRLLSPHLGERVQQVDGGRDGGEFSLYMITQSSRTERAYIAWREISDTQEQILTS
jgi:hypothetical protein